MNETFRKIGVIASCIILGIALGIAGTGAYYNGRIGELTKLVTEYRTAVADLELRNNNLVETQRVIRETNRKLEASDTERREIERLAREVIKELNSTVTDFGGTIKRLQREGASLSVQLREAIGTVQNVIPRVRLLEEYFSSGNGGGSNSGIISGS